MSHGTRTSYLQHKAWRQSGRAKCDVNLSNRTPSPVMKVSRFSGGPLTTTETTPLQMAIRSDNAMRRRMVKPSMPKMPWEDTEQDTKP